MPLRRTLLDLRARSVAHLDVLERLGVLHVMAALARGACVLARPPRDTFRRVPIAQLALVRAQRLDLGLYEPTNVHPAVSRLGAGNVDLAHVVRRYACGSKLRKSQTCARHRHDRCESGFPGASGIRVTHVAFAGPPAGWNPPDCPAR